MLLTHSSSPATHTAFCHQGAQVSGGRQKAAMKMLTAVITRINSTTALLADGRKALIRVFHPSKIGASLTAVCAHGLLQSFQPKLHFREVRSVSPALLFCIRELYTWCFLLIYFYCILVIKPLRAVLCTSEQARWPDGCSHKWGEMSEALCRTWALRRTAPAPRCQHRPRCARAERAVPSWHWHRDQSSGNGCCAGEGWGALPRLPWYLRNLLPAAKAHPNVFCFLPGWRTWLLLYTPHRRVQSQLYMGFIKTSTPRWLPNPNLAMLHLTLPASTILPAWQGFLSYGWWFLTAVYDFVQNPFCCQEQSFLKSHFMPWLHAREMPSQLGKLGWLMRLWWSTSQWVTDYLVLTENPNNKQHLLHLESSSVVHISLSMRYQQDKSWALGTSSLKLVLMVMVKRNHISLKLIPMS